MGRGQRPAASALPGPGISAPSSTSTPSSSASSRCSASTGSSPGSTLPPGSSQPPARCGGSVRRAASSVAGPSRSSTTAAPTTRRRAAGRLGLCQRAAMSIGSPDAHALRSVTGRSVSYRSTRSHGQRPPRCRTPARHGAGRVWGHALDRMRRRGQRSDMPTVLTPAELDHQLAELPGVDRDRAGRLTLTVTAPVSPTPSPWSPPSRTPPRLNHHPDVDLRWRTVTFTLSTHSAGGVSELDLHLAGEVLGRGTGRRAGATRPAADRDRPGRRRRRPGPPVLGSRPGVRGRPRTGAGAGPELHDRTGRGPVLWFQRMDPPRTGRGRFHLDVYPPPRPRRLEPAWRGRDAGHRRTRRLVGAGRPEGNELCAACRPPDGRTGTAVTGRRLRLGTAEPSGTVRPAARIRASASRQRTSGSAAPATPRRPITAGRSGPAEPARAGAPGGRLQRAGIVPVAGSTLGDRAMDPGGDRRPAARCSPRSAAGVGGRDRDCRQDTAGGG